MSHVPNPARFWDLATWFESQEGLYCDWEGLAAGSPVLDFLASTLANDWDNAPRVLQDVMLHVAYELVDQAGTEHLTARWAWDVWAALQAVFGCRYWMRRDTQ